MRGCIKLPSFEKEKTKALLEWKLTQYNDFLHFFHIVFVQ